jgi:hypothetical protein
MNKVMKGTAAALVAVMISGSIFAEERPVKANFKAENPVADIDLVRPAFFRSDIKSPHKKDFIVEMRDMMGKYVYTTAALNNDNGQTKYDIDIPPVASGVYYYNILNDEGEIRTSGKLVKE